MKKKKKGKGKGVEKNKYEKGDMRNENRNWKRKDNKWCVNICGEWKKGSSRFRKYKKGIENWYEGKRMEGK